MEKTWIKLYRDLLDWEWYLDQNVKALYIHLLLKASFENNSWMSYKLNPGQLITGRKKLAKETGLSEQEVRTCLSKLIKTGEINQQPTNQFSIITICKWDSYQYVKTEDENTATNDQPAINQQSTTTKESKEGRESKEVKKTPRKKPEVDFIDGIVSLFQDEYKASKNLNYEILSKGKERAAAGSILKLFKTNNPEASTEQIESKIKEFFHRALNIDDNWLSTNMSLPILSSKFNEIHLKLNSNGHTNFSTGKQFPQLEDSKPRGTATSEEHQLDTLQRFASGGF